MLASSIGWILVGSGTITAAAGLGALLFPNLFLRLVVEVESSISPLMFFVQHWGVLILAVGALITYSAYVPTVRVPVLAAAAIEKFAIGLLAFLGPMRRTPALTAMAVGDSAFAILYVAYLAGL